MIRSINYRVSEKSIDPSNKQWLGMQYEDGATEIAFDVSNMPSYGDYLWRIDFDQVTAGYSAGVSEGAAEGKISRLLPYDMTRFGGDVQITLVGTLDGEIVYSIPVSGYLKAVRKSEPSEDKQAIDISSAEYNARQSAANAMDAADRAEISAEEAKKSEELTEDARRILEEGTEFVFLGGDAKSKHTVDLVVDDTLTEYGTNPVEGQAVFEKFSKIDADLKEYISAAFADFGRSITDSILKEVYPVGSIYISESATDPGTLFGGDWKRLRNTFILAAGNEDEKFPMGCVGGYSEITLTEEQMPAHSHKASDLTIGGYDYHFQLIKSLISGSTGREGVVIDKTSSHKAVTANTASDDFTGIDDIYACETTAETGKGEAVSIMPPYVTRYVWQRTA